MVGPPFFPLVASVAFAATGVPSSRVHPCEGFIAKTIGKLSEQGGSVCVGFSRDSSSGVVSLYVSMCFHIVVANDGYHFVPKTALTFKDTYVDIRQFSITDWQRSTFSLAEAMMHAEKHDVIQDAGQNAVHNAFDNLWNRQNAVAGPRGRGGVLGTPR